MYTDELAKFVDAEDVAGAWPLDFADGYYDLGVSPDLGAGGDIAVIITVDDYLDGVSDGSQLSVIAGDNPDFSAGDNVILGGTTYYFASEWANRNDGPASPFGFFLPLVIKINPLQDQNSDYLVSGVKRRYIGIMAYHGAFHGPSAPDTMVITAQIVKDIHSDPGHGFHKTSLIVK